MVKESKNKNSLSITMLVKITCLGIISSLLFSGCKSFFPKQSYTVNPADSVIVLPDKPDNIKKFAAEELQKHLKLITGVEIPIVESNKFKQKKAFPFYVGISPEKGLTLKKEQASYTVAPKKVYIYGDDFIGTKSRIGIYDALALQINRTGTLFAVYSFLENELGIRWIEPGDKGIVYKPEKLLHLKEGTFTWTPELQMRFIRSGLWRWKNVKSFQEDLAKPMQYTKKEAEKKYLDDLTWMKRMKMGRHIKLSYGHAFTRWWDKYGKTHPEFFAANEKGERRPFANGGKPDRIKMCVTNKGLHKEMVKQWLSRYDSIPESGVINVCENDSAGYCRCPKCTALDVQSEGEEFGKHLSDRYIWFANEVIKELRKTVPNGKAVMYAYSVYKYPPRKQKVDDGVIIGFVPGLMRPLDELDQFYSDWNTAGAKELFLRPNDMHIDTGLPMGFEKKMFDNFKVGINNGIIGTDYDTLHGFWGSSGIGNYILSRAHSQPDKPFEYWEDEYCSTYGPAQNDVKEYYRYWRDVWNNRFLPNREHIAKVGRYGNFRRGLMWELPKYYSSEDFDKTDAILKRGVAKNLTDLEKKRLENLMLANQHARLAFEAVSVNSRLNKSPDPVKRLNASRKLLEFRKKHKHDLNINWPYLFKIEKEFGDVTGVKFASCFNKDVKPYKQLPLYMHFKLDPENIGLKEGWEKKSWKELKKWDRIRTDRGWERQVKISEPLRKKLEKYDGIGWYAVEIRVNKDIERKKVYLVFGAVDESCWVYVNGKKVDQHLFSKPDDWKTPFAIRIDQGFSKGIKQTIIVRVEDKAGMGGIWKPVWLAIAD